MKPLSRRINLLPTQAQTHLPQQKDFLVLGGLGVVLLLIFSLGGIQLYRSHQVQNKLTQETLKEASIKRQIASIEAEKKILEEVNKKQNMAKEVVTQNTYWTDLFKEITLVIPQDIWLSYFKVIRVDKKLEFSLIGETPSPQKVASLYKDLENSYYFQNVILKKSELLEGFQPPLYRFQFDTPNFNKKPETQKVAEVKK